MDLETVKITAMHVFGNDVSETDISEHAGAFWIGFKTNEKPLDVELLTAFRNLTDLNVTVGVYVSVSDKWKHYGRLMLVAKARA